MNVLVGELADAPLQECSFLIGEKGRTASAAPIWNVSRIPKRGAVFNQTEAGDLVRKVVILILR
jgi:hypothetical protein